MTEFQDFIFGMVPDYSSKSKVNEKISNNDDFEDCFDSFNPDRKKTSHGKNKSRYFSRRNDLKKNFGSRGNWEDIVESKAGERKARLKERRKSFKPDLNNYQKSRKDNRSLLQNPKPTIYEIFQKIYFSGRLDEKILARKAKFSKEIEKDKEKLCPKDSNDPEVLAIESFFEEFQKNFLKKNKRKSSKESKFKPNPKDVFFQESEAEILLCENIEQEYFDKLERKINARADEFREEMKCNGESICECGCNLPRELAEREFGICTL